MVSCASCLTLERSACLGYSSDYILVTWWRKSAPYSTGPVFEALNSLVDLCYSRITVSSDSTDLWYPSAGFICLIKRNGPSPDVKIRPVCQKSWAQCQHSRGLVPKSRASYRVVQILSGRKNVTKICLSNPSPLNVGINTFD